MSVPRERTEPGAARKCRNLTPFRLTSQSRPPGAAWSDAEEAQEVVGDRPDHDPDDDDEPDVREAESLLHGERPTADALDEEEEEFEDEADDDEDEYEEEDDEYEDDEEDD